MDTSLARRLGPVSGGHVNPTVTLALAARGRFSWREVPPYLVAQLVGGVLGAALAYAAYAEAIDAFILVTAVLALAVAPNAPTGVHGIGIGLALATRIGGLTAALPCGYIAARRPVVATRPPGMT